MTTPTRGSDAGILSKKQRAYLRNESDIEVGEKSRRERALRSRIRSRFVESLYDLELLNNFLEDRDRQAALVALEEDEDRPSYPHFATQVLELMFRGALDPDTDCEMFPDEERNFSEMIEYPLTLALLDVDEDVIGVTADITITRVEGVADSDGPALAELPERELKQALHLDQITSEQFVEAIEEKKSLDSQ